MELNKQASTSHEPELATADVSDDAAENAPSHGYNLRSNRFSGNYTTPYQFIQFTNQNQRSVNTYQFIVAMCFTQMSASKGIKTYGQATINTLLKEFSKLNDLKVFKSVCVSTLTYADKKSALRAINLMKEKWCGKIKGRS